MAKIGKVAVLDQVEGTFEVKEYEVPRAEPGTFLLKTELCGVCATDVHMYYGRFPDLQFPIILGHEHVGIIEELGSGRTVDYLGRPVKEGDRIIPAAGAGCGECYYCRIARTPTRCQNGATIGFTPDTADWRFAGGYGQYVYHKHSNMTFLKTDLPADVAVLLEPMCVGMNGVNRAGVRLGDTAVVQGAGAIGILAAVCAKRAGAANVIMVGAPKARLELAKKFGVDVVIDIDEHRSAEERIKLVKEETRLGIGADIVFECAGVPAAIPEGIAYLRDSARYVELGAFTDRGDVAINPHWDLLQKNVTLYAMWGDEITDYAQALPLLEKLEYPYAEIVSHKVPLTRVKDAVDAIGKGGYVLDGRGAIKIAVDPWMS
jgi:L-iditol 2-dehydrogenase